MICLGQIPIFHHIMCKSNSLKTIDLFVQMQIISISHKVLKTDIRKPTHKM